MHSRAGLVLAFLALAAGKTAGAADLESIKTRGTLRVIVAAEEAIETFDPAGKVGGFERDLVDSFAHRHGLRVEIVTARTYSDRIPALLSGKGDLVVAIFDTAERRQQVAFTVEVMPTFTVAVTSPGKKTVATLDDLRRLRVGVLKGTAPADEAGAAGIASLVRYDTSDAMLGALRSGEVGAVAMPVSELALATKKTPGLGSGVQIGPSGSVAWAVRKEDTALRAALDEHLSNVRRSASWNLLLVKYFGEQAPVVLGRGR